MTTTTSYATCPLCEAICGIAVEHDGERVLRIRGDDADAFSRGYICPKAVALEDLHADPDRLRRPLRRKGSTWEEIGWDEALDEAAARLTEVRRQHGRDAVGLYIGNPTAHSYSAILSVIGFGQLLRTRSVFSSNSVDALPRLVTSLHLYGSQALLPVPDLERTDFLLILGANPVVSNGSVMTAPDCAHRLKEIQARGGAVIVVDPRRTETAEIADEHLFIRPGGDAFLLLAMLSALFDMGRESACAAPSEERLMARARLEPLLEGVDRVRALVSPFTPERVAPRIGIAAEQIRGLARRFAGARSAVCYGRMGTCTQEFGAVASWLIDLLNILTGNFDRPGGAMFATPAVDLAGLAAALGQSGHFNRWRSRVSGLPEFNGELPAAAMAEEMETPGEGQVRALITHAGNPVLSLPNGRRIERALERLDFMVSIDIYLNETTRHAHLILPPTFGLEHDHYPILFGGLSIRNNAKYSPAVFQPGPDARHDWEIITGLARRVLARHGAPAAAAGAALEWIARRVRPQGILDLALRAGPRGSFRRPFGRAGLSLDALRAEPHGLDLGPLMPRLPGVLRTRGKRLRLAPEVFARDLRRIEAALDDRAPAPAPDELLLIGRRQLRSNNSWMHNSVRLVKGRNRCTLQMHPEDAARRGVRQGERVRIASRVGEVMAEVEVTEAVMRGVVSLPHGWGHDRDGTRLDVARRHAGVSVNDLTDDRLVDALSGCSNLSGIPVSVSPNP